MLPSPTSTGPPPRSVTVALGLLLAQVVGSLALTVGLLGDVVLSVLTNGVWLALGLALRAGRLWARILLTALAVLAVLLTPTRLAEPYALTVPPVVVLVGLAVAMTIAMYRPSAGRFLDPPASDVPQETSAPWTPPGGPPVRATSRYRTAVVVLATILGVGLPGSVVLFVLGVGLLGGGCSALSTRFACTPSGQFLLGWDPFLGTAAGAVLALVGLVRLRRGGESLAWSYAGFALWLVSSAVWVGAGV